MRRVSTPNDRVVVVGAGTTPLVAELILAGYHLVDAVDVSPLAVDRLTAQLGDQAERVTVRCADVRTSTFAEQVDVWHDRAVFHFFTAAADRAMYAARAADAVRPGGHLVIGAFASNGPTECSGLPVARQDVNSLTRTFDGFDLVESFDRVHVTPWGAEQHFVHAVFRRAAASRATKRRT